jgi:hypothetical protein
MMQDAGHQTGFCLSKANCLLFIDVALFCTEIAVSRQITPLLP